MATARDVIGQLDKIGELTALIKEKVQPAVLAHGEDGKSIDIELAVCQQNAHDLYEATRILYVQLHDYSGDQLSE